MATAVIKLDPLPDAVWAGAQDHDLLAFGRLGFALVLEHRVEVGSEALEFGCTRIDSLVDGVDTRLLALLADRGFAHIP